jgi:zinc transporter
MSATEFPESVPETALPGPPRRLAAGVEPGLRFAALLDGRGGCSDLDWSGIAEWRRERGFLWIHLERDAPETERWLRQSPEIHTTVEDLLLAEDSRPRVELVGEGLLLVLRGVNLQAEEVELVPIHVWVDAGRMITLRDRSHSLNALRDIRVDLVEGRGPHNAADLLLQVCAKIVRDVEPCLEQMDAEVSQLEEQVGTTPPSEMRKKLGDLRRRAIHLRRYLTPQREALFHLQNTECGLFDLHHRLHLSSVIDTVIRFLEDLEAIRERTTVVHEEMSALINEQIAQTSYRLTALATLLLTPGLVVGMLGANVGGIPGHEHPWGFPILTLVMVAILIVQLIVYRWLRWL